MQFKRNAQGGAESKRKRHRLGNGESEPEREGADDGNEEDGDADDGSGDDQSSGRGSVQARTDDQRQVCLEIELFLSLAWSPNLFLFHLQSGNAGAHAAFSRTDFIRAIGGSESKPTQMVRRG